jgi:hypothetical protein
MAMDPGHAIKLYEVEALRRLGLRDPIAQIVDSLVSHPEVIPHAGVLGGTMGFYARDAISVLDEARVYARFDDGHIEGFGLFQFEIRPDTSIAWTVLYSTVDAE